MIQVALSAKNQCAVPSALKGKYRETSISGSQAAGVLASHRIQSSDITPEKAAVTRRKMLANEHRNAPAFLQPRCAHQPGDTANKKQTSNAQQPRIPQKESSSSLCAPQGAHRGPDVRDSKRAARTQDLQPAPLQARSDRLELDQASSKRGGRQNPQRECQSIVPPHTVVAPKSRAREDPVVAVLKSPEPMASLRAKGGMQPQHSVRTWLYPQKKADVHKSKDSSIFTLGATGASCSLDGREDAIFLLRPVGRPARSTPRSPLVPFSDDLDAKTLPSLARRSLSPAYGGPQFENAPQAASLPFPILSLSHLKEVRNVT